MWRPQNDLARRELWDERRDHKRQQREEQQ